MLMALQPMNQVVLKPREYPHTEAGLDQMAHDILRLGEDTRVIMEAAFTERYRKWCKRKGYHFSDSKAADLYIDSIGHITTLPKNSNTKLIITTAAAPL